MDGQDDVIGGWVVALYKALMWKGVEPSVLLEHSSISHEEIANVGSRVPLTLCNKLFEHAQTLTDDPLLPIKISQCIVPTTFHALGYSVQACASLKDAFERLVQYQQMISSVCAISFTSNNGSYYLELGLNNRVNSRSHISEVLELSMLLSLIKISRDLSHPGFTPVKIYTTASSRCVSQYQEYVGCEIEFSAKQSMLVLDGAQLEARLPNFAPDLILLSDKAADEYMSRLDRGNVVSQVRSEVVALMAKGAPSIDLVAEKLNFSQRSLQRKLNDSGTSYKHLVENIRQAMAEQYLNQNQLSLGEISYLLGFANVANFSRAFKRWKGISPGAYRGEHMDYICR